MDLTTTNSTVLLQQVVKMQVYTANQIQWIFVFCLVLLTGILFWSILKRSFMGGR